MKKILILVFLFFALLLAVTQVSNYLAKHSLSGGIKQNMYASSIHNTPKKDISVNSSKKNETSSNSDISTSIYEYIKNANNQQKVFTKAVILNDNRPQNTCVYFVSEILRGININVPTDICNTNQLINYLTKTGWKKDTDYSKLKKGDLCFTTDGMLNPNGTPTHTYIFMGWKQQGNFDYAYVCDNQAKEYNGQYFHLRNISITDKINNTIKEPFSFFMHK